MLVFLLAGMNVPLHAAWTIGRWVVLAIGAAVGFTLYLKKSSPKIYHAALDSYLRNNSGSCFRIGVGLSRQLLY